MTTFRGDGFSFEYPGQWQMISGYEHAGLHGPTVLAAVGIGDFDLGCTYTSTSVTCGPEPRWTVAEDGIVLAYRFGAWLGPIALGPTSSLGPGETWVSVGGRPAVLSQTDNSMLWHFPGAPEFIEARWGSEDATQARSLVGSTISTWAWTPTPS